MTLWREEAEKFNPMVHNSIGVYNGSLSQYGGGFSIGTKPDSSIMVLHFYLHFFCVNKLFISLELIYSLILRQQKAKLWFNGLRIVILVL